MAVRLLATAPPPQEGIESTSAGQARLLLALGELRAALGDPSILKLWRPGDLWRGPGLQLAILILEIGERLGDDASGAGATQLASLLLEATRNEGCG